MDHGILCFLQIVTGSCTHAVSEIPSYSGRVNVVTAVFLYKWGCPGNDWRSADRDNAYFLCLILSAFSLTIGYLGDVSAVFLHVNY